MQISGTNLLIAAQQPTAAPVQPQSQQAFASNLRQTAEASKAEPPKEDFAPLAFRPVAPAAQAAKTASTPAPQSTPTGAKSLGQTIDIRV